MPCKTKNYNAIHICLLYQVPHVVTTCECDISTEVPPNVEQSPSKPCMSDIMTVITSVETDHVSP